MVLPFKSLSSMLGGLENPSLLAGAHSANTKLQFNSNTAKHKRFLINIT